MHAVNWVLVGCGMWSLAGCQSAPAAPEVTAAEVTAVLSEPSTQARAIIQKTINGALSRDVLLADDALINSSLLIIEQKPRQSIGAPPAQGRNMDLPIMFRLVTNGSSCSLMSLSDEKRYPLAGVKCTVENR